MSAATIAVATYEYRNAEGKRRRGFFGDVVDLAGDELARAERAGAVRPAVETAEQSTDEQVDASEESDDEQPDLAGDELARPPRAAAKAAWVEYAVSKGMAEDDAEALSKNELIAQFGSE